MLRKHLPLIISASTGTQYFAAVGVLNMLVHNLNSLDAYTLHTVHEQDLVVVRHERTATCMLLLACYIARNVIHAYITHMLLVSIS